MFLGQYGLALAAKRAAPGTSLGTLFMAAQLLDEIWPVLLLAGVERVCIVPGTMAATPLVFKHYPWSHSLLMAVPMHARVLPLWPGSDVFIGFGLWRSVLVTLMLEFGLLAAGTARIWVQPRRAIGLIYRSIAIEYVFR